MTDEITHLKAKLHNALQQLMETTAENQILKAENSKLKARISELQINNGTSTISSFDPRSANSLDIPEDLLLKSSLKLSKVEKITLFSDLFKGREDVYPTRWENSRTGKAGFVIERKGSITCRC